MSQIPELELHKNRNIFIRWLIIQDYLLFCFNSAHQENILVKLCDDMLYFDAIKLHFAICGSWHQLQSGQTLSLLMKGQEVSLSGRPSQTLFKSELWDPAKYRSYKRFMQSKYPAALIHLKLIHLNLLKPHLAEMLSVLWKSQQQLSLYASGLGGWFESQFWTKQLDSRTVAGLVLGWFQGTPEGPLSKVLNP